MFLCSFLSLLPESDVSFEFLCTSGCLCTDYLVYDDDDDDDDIKEINISTIVCTMITYSVCITNTHEPYYIDDAIE